MGTRSTIHWYNNGKNVMNIYTQYDGYLTGVGQQIVDYFEGDKRGNGIEDDALMYILKYKNGAYNIYATTENDEQEFNYYIYSYYDTNEQKNKLEFKVTQDRWIEEYNCCGIITLLRYGTLEDLKQIIKEEENELDNWSE